MSLNKHIESITSYDLQALVDDGFAECKSIDYKKALFLDTDDKKYEFRRDVTSFANAAGGHIIYGVNEKNGLPVELCGMTIDNVERTLQKLDELFQSRIKPRIYGYAIQPILIPGKGHAIVVRIPKSFNSPHQVVVNKDDFEFWSRASTGKYRLDVDELRIAFTLSETLNERIRNFRMDRLGRILAGQTPISMGDGKVLECKQLTVGTEKENCLLIDDTNESLFGLSQKSKD